MNCADLEKLYNPEQFAETARLHANAFNWQPQGRIPLGIHVVDPEYAEGLDYRDWLDPEPFLEFQTRVLVDTLAVRSDLLPTVGINHLGDALVTSMFGAEQRMPDVEAAALQSQIRRSTLWDMGPTPLPVFSDIGDVASLQMPSLDSGIMPDVRRIARCYRDSLPPWVHVIAPMPTGPFSAAMELRGSALLLDMVEQPALCKKLIDICARLQVMVEIDIRNLVGTRLDRHVTSFGVLGVGLRLGEDSLVNLSPAMIKDFGVPSHKTVNGLLPGQGHIHFCSLPYSRFEHIYGTLAAVPEVTVVSSQFGFEYYAQHLDELKGRLAVESFYGDAYSYVSERYGSFRDWAFDFVPRFRNASGLVLYCEVRSVEEGCELWTTWQEAHGS